MKHILIAVIMVSAISSLSARDRFYEKKNPNRYDDFVPNPSKPGDLVTADKNMVLTMDNRQATIMGNGGINLWAHNEAMNTMSSWNSDKAWVEWNLDIPRDGEYFVDFSWTAGKDSGEATFLFICGDEKVEWKRPKGVHWDYLHAARTGKMSLKQGQAVFELKRTAIDPGKGIANVAYVKLVPVQKDYAERVQAISKKSLIELTPRERKTIWGISAFIPAFELEEGDIKNRAEQLKMDPATGESLYRNYLKITPNVTQERYYIDGTFYTATLCHQRCIALDIAKENMTSADALELVRTILPKSKFKITKKEMDTSRFFLNSKDQDNNFDLEYWQFDGLKHITIHNHKLVMDLANTKTTRLKGCIDDMYRRIAQSASRSGKKDLLKSNWLDLNEQGWNALMGGPSAGECRMLRSAAEAQEWLFDSLSLKVQFDKNGKLASFAICTPVEIIPKDMIGLASKLLPALSFESPDSALLSNSEYNLKARAPKGRLYQCSSCRLNDVTEFSITPVVSASNNQDYEPAKKEPAGASKLGL